MIKTVRNYLEMKTGRKGSKLPYIKTLRKRSYLQIKTASKRSYL